MKTDLSAIWDAEVVPNLDFLPGRRHHDIGAMTNYDGFETQARYNPDDNLYYVDHALPRDARMEHPVQIQAVAADDYEAQTLYLTPGSVVCLWYRDIHRKRVTVSNPNAVSVVIGKRSQVTAGQGYVLLAGKEREFTGASEMFAAPQLGYAGAALPLGVLSERG